MCSSKIDGHLLLPGLLAPAHIAGLRPGILDAFERHRPGPGELTRPQTAYERAFIQVVNMGLTEPALRALTWSPRLGAVAAALMGTAGARIFVEDAMFKAPDSGRTPWHQDASCLPMAPSSMVTAWVPLVPVGSDSGRLRFVRGSHRLEVVCRDDISEASDAFFETLIAERGLTVTDLPEMQPGDISFHSGSTIHAAHANRSSHMRELLAVHYFADGARIADLGEDSRPMMLARHLAPTLGPGDLADAPAWPCVYRRSRR